MPTKAELQSALEDAATTIAELEARVAELGTGVPLPSETSSAATLDEVCQGLPCASFIRIDQGFRYEKRMFQPGMSVLNPPKGLLLLGDGKWSWCDGITFATSARRLHRTKDGWMSWQGPEKQ